MSFPLSWLLTSLVSFVAAAVVSNWLAPMLARHGAVAIPGPDGLGRALPRGGGVAIVAVTAASAVYATWIDPTARWSILAWLVPALGVAAVSLRDDFAPLPAILRLAVHVAAASVMVASAQPIREITIAGLVLPDLGKAAWPLTIFWVVGMTNVFNFMDGIDGIAGITITAAGASLAVAAAAFGCGPAAAVAVSLAAGSLGFLTANWPPAKLFMGDVGSTFCGFTIAAVPLLVPAACRGGILAVAMLSAWPFVFDAALTLIKRLANRENVLKPHRSHLYQRLVIAGWSHAAVSRLYGLLAAVCGGVAVMAVGFPQLRAVAEGLTIVAVVLVPVLLITLVQVSEARATSLAK